MRFALNGSEMADWMECWCWRCEHDHDMSHAGATEENGCGHVLATLIGADDPVL